MAEYSDDYVRVFDTTLRDGEQSPGATMTSDEKRKVAAMLARLGADVIEAGFPAASPDDLEAVRQIATADYQTPSGAPPIVCALARAARADIDAAWRAVEPAARPRIHTFLATSDLHIQHKLRITRAEVVARVREMVAYARDRCDDVEFSPEDAGRSEPEFLYQVLATAVAAGATTLNIPDTVGYTTPDEFGALIAGIIAHTDGIDRAVVSVHCHNDLGLATANSLAGIRAGARQVEVAVNGIGERAGNTALEEVVMALHTRRRWYRLRTGIDTTQIVRASKLVSSVTGLVVAPNKAVVGANAFAHEAGIHQDGMLKHHETYEIMRPETVGAGRSRLVLGKHSGRHAVKVRLAELGYQLTDAELDQAFERFKKLAERKKTIADADLEAVVTDELDRERAHYRLDGLQVVCGTMGLATATVRLRGPDGQVWVAAAVGGGPVDAAYKAIDDIVGERYGLLGFRIQAVTSGIDALGEVTVRVQGERRPGAGGEPWVAPTSVGHGADTDIVVASARAYLSALDKLERVEQRRRLAVGESARPGEVRW